MCRQLAAVGSGIPVEHLLLDAPQALAVQAWAPRRQQHGVVNADGAGLGWHPGVDAEPLRHRTSGPVWADETFVELVRGPVPGAACIVASVRSATAGTAHGVAAAMPFRAGRYLFAHNGALDGWPDAAAPLAAGLDVRRLLRLDAVTDAALLWALVRDRLDTGLGLADAVADVTRAVLDGCGGRVNLLVADGRQVVATAAGASLSYLEPAAAAQHWCVLASEPVDDDPAWVDVPDRSLLVATAAGVQLRSL